MAVKYTKRFHSKAFQNITKYGILVCKYTTWQPCHTIPQQNSISHLCSPPGAYAMI
jgi:hypothetical protein